MPADEAVARRQSAVRCGITRYLTERIIKGDLKPGEWIREAHLAKHLGVSRAPIREALQILQRNRLVELMPRQGARVAPLSEQYVRWLYDILLELYTFIVRQMILKSDPDSTRILDAIVEKIQNISLPYRPSGSHPLEKHPKPRRLPDIFSNQLTTSNKKTIVLSEPINHPPAP